MTDGSPCAFGGCGGSLDGGYCDTCGRAPLAAAFARRSAAGRRPLASSPVRRRASLLRSPVRRRASPLRSPVRRQASPPRPSPSPRRRATQGQAGGTTPGLACARHRSAPTRPAGGRVPAGAPPRWPAAGPGAPGWASASSTSPPSRPATPPRRSCRSPRCPRTSASAPSAASPVGRSRNDRPGRTEGFCRQCRTQFSFTPKLAAGDLVAGQYEVLGALAHGGLGWIYLARDRAVSDRWVVLKGLLDAASEEAALAAVAERRFLAALDHPNVVPHLQLRHPRGRRLHRHGVRRRQEPQGDAQGAARRQRRPHRPAAGRPGAIAYALGVLPAMGYFHAQGLVYCDMKPDNVVLSGDSLKIIDLGGVRHIDDDEAAIYGTIGYQAPEVAETGSDGRVRPVHGGPHAGRAAPRLPAATRAPTSDRLPPARRATAARSSTSRCTGSCSRRPPTDPIDRFDSADEMAEQLARRPPGGSGGPGAGPAGGEHGVRARRRGGRRRRRRGAARLASAAAAQGRLRRPRRRLPARPGRRRARRRGRHA